jgi:ribosome production factor 2
MIEFGVENFKSLQDFKTSKVMTGVKPCLIFTGDLWHQNEEYTKCKSLLLDFFRGEQVEQVRLAGFELALSFTAAEGKIYFRSYKQVPNYDLIKL